MRVSILCLFLVLVSVCQAQQFHTKAFVDQKFHSDRWKTIERFEMSEAKIVEMGHDKFVAWYCDHSRAGKDGRIQAEKVWGLAHAELNAPILLKLPRKEQLFMEGMISAFADMAKSSFVAGIMGSQEEGWTLKIAESTSAVSETIYAILHPSVIAPQEPKVNLEAIYAEVTERVDARYPNSHSGGGRLKSCLEYIQNHFKDRSAREKAVAKVFSVKMVQMALYRPEVTLQLQDSVASGANTIY